MTRNEWDVVIVGARIAGCAAAIRFADAGYKVLAIDKGREGSDTLSSHGFGGENPMEQLDQLGVLDEVLATDAPHLDVFRLDWADGTLSMPIENQWGHSLCVRRTTLDPILARKARSAGADVRFDTELVDVVREGDRVVGVLITTADGDAEEHRARLVIGADGRHSKMAGLVNASSYREVASPTSAFYAYLENVSLMDGKEAFQFASGSGVDGIIAACDGNISCVLLIVSNEDFDGALSDAAAYFDRGIQTLPGIASRLKEARRVSKVRPSGPREVDGRYRQAAGLGWALVGDAGLKEHPALGRGIGDGMRCAEILHAAVEKAWKGGRDLDRCLAAFGKQRDLEFTPAYDASFVMASLNPMSKGGMQEMMVANLKIAAAKADAAAAVAGDW